MNSTNQIDNELKYALFIIGNGFVAYKVCYLSVKHTLDIDQRKRCSDASGSEFERALLSIQAPISNYSFLYSLWVVCL